MDCNIKKLSNFSKIYGTLILDIQTDVHKDVGVENEIYNLYIIFIFIETQISSRINVSRD